MAAGAPQGSWMHVNSCSLLCLLPTHARTTREGRSMVFTVSVYAGGAWSRLALLLRTRSPPHAWSKATYTHSHVRATCL